MPIPLGYLCSVCKIRYDIEQNAVDCEAEHEELAQPVVASVGDSRSPTKTPRYPNVGSNYDWDSAIEVSSGPEWAWEDVQEVLAASEGYNDGPDWIAVVRLKDGQYASVVAGCDYTGWDCVAGGTKHIKKTLAEIYWQCLGDEPRERVKQQLQRI